MELKKCIRTLLTVGMIVPALFSQQAQRPLTNSDIINMVKSKLPESVVVQAIQSNPGKYDTSTTALVSLHKAGVTENELNAMIAASSKGGASAASSSSAQSAAVSKSRKPTLSVNAGGS